MRGRTKNVQKAKSKPATVSKVLKKPPEKEVSTKRGRGRPRTRKQDELYEPLEEEPAAKKVKKNDGIKSLRSNKNGLKNNQRIIQSNLNDIKKEKITKENNESPKKEKIATETKIKNCTTPTKNKNNVPNGVHLETPLTNGNSEENPQTSPESGIFLFETKRESNGTFSSNTSPSVPDPLSMPDIGPDPNDSEDDSSEYTGDAPLSSLFPNDTDSNNENSQDLPDLENQVFSCQECGFSSDKCSKVISHECSGVSRTIFGCDRCTLSFSQLNELILHLANHAVFTCGICKKSFRTKGNLKNHMKSHMYNALNMNPAQEEEALMVINEIDNEEAQSPTKDCKVSSESFVNTVTGPNVNKKYVCSICGKATRAKADLIKHIRIHTGERPFKCKQCDASFVQVTALRYHETRHSGKKPFVCAICEKGFALKDRLRLHMRLHTGEKPNKCETCGKTFARRSQLINHMPRHNPNRPKYKCEECNQEFSSYHIMKGHLNAHKGIKEFQCGACGKKFIRVEGMYKHIRTVHHGSRPYTCTVCGKTFKGHLQQHMRLHTGVRPYECPTCHASFTQNSQLTVHMRIHTGERPYKCQVCGSAFAHSSACKIHMRSHTGEKPFKCVLCETTFSQLPHLKKHMKCVHNASKPYLCTLCKDQESFFQTQNELDSHKKIVHHLFKTPEQEAEEIVEEASLTRLRNRLAVLLYRISSDERRAKFGFGTNLIDSVLKKSLLFSGHQPVTDKSMSALTELRHNAHLLLKWTIPKDTMEEYHKNNMTVDEVIDMLTS